MSFETVWAELREQCESLDPDAALETPTTSRVLRIETVRETGIDVHTPESEESRTLNRERFRSFVDEVRSGADGLQLATLPPGAEPYVAVLSLHPEFAIEDGALVESEDGNGDGSDADRSLVVPSWEDRTAPVRLRDDATILVDLLERFEGDVEIEALVDLYVLLSDVQYEAGDLREEVRDDLLESMEADERLHGRFGAVTRTERERRRLKDEATILHTLDEAGIPREWVLGIDRQKLDVVVAVTDIDDEDVYDTETESYVQKTDVDRLERDAHVRGLAEQLPALESDRARRLHDEIEDIEERIDSLLATG